MRFHKRRHLHFRPPWWPENESWPPPQRWRHMRGPFFRRMGCLFLLFNVFAFIGFIAFLRYLLAPFIEIHGAPPLDQPGIFVPLGFAGFVLVIVVVFIGIRSLRRMSGPLDELVVASNKVADGDFAVRVEVNGPPEMRSLLHGFNSMAERLEENDTQRKNLLADISHELRTPLTIIQGNVEGILDGMYKADEARLRSILEESQILARLIEDLRTLALADSGSLHLEKESADMGKLIQDAVAGFQKQASNKQIKFDLKINELDEIFLDSHRIHEVLVNLISNAIHFSPNNGLITVGLEELSSDGRKEALAFIQDRGPGMDPAQLEQIFDRFYKSSDSGGMGLGLSIAKSLVQSHGGAIWAESEAGHGTRISFTLPR